MKIILDTETTGLKADHNALLQLSIINEANKPLFNAYFKPSDDHFSGKLLQDWKIAATINGITPEKVKDCLPLDSYREKIQSILNQADEILIYNANFDVGFMKSHGFSFKDSTKITDVMKEFSCYKLKNKRFKLSVAASEFGYTFSAHDSLEDVKATLVVHNCVNKIFNKNVFIKYFYHIIKIYFKYF
ncbi:MAG: 3'-5' exonuclease [Succinivibrio sp.]|nr:3'-5' exonuclease [Succinivibrio sp.]